MRNLYSLSTRQRKVLSIFYPNVLSRTITRGFLTIVGRNPPSFAVLSPCHQLCFELIGKRLRLLSRTQSPLHSTEHGAYCYMAPDMLIPKRTAGFFLASSLQRSSKCGSMFIVLRRTNITPLSVIDQSTIKTCYDFERRVT